jgi:hypothetical protein
MARTYAKARRVPGKMNALETQYLREVIEPQIQSGKFISYKFEQMNFRLADRTFYQPDFFVVRDDGYIEIHEVKGYWEEDALVKIKCAAELFPEFSWKGCQRKGGKNNGVWSYRHFGPQSDI